MAAAHTSKPVLEFKGRMLTLTILHLQHPSVEVLARELDRRVQEAPALFRDLPVILDVAEVAGSDLNEDLPGLAELLRTRGLIPIGLRGCDERWADGATAAGLSVLAAESVPSVQDGSGESAQAAPAANGAGAPGAGRCGMVVTEPVRSGQQVYARGADLVILATVSPGAEVVADGHIHVYSALNGRALAGAHGDRAARIFCKRFRAELVSIAGTYNVSEQFDESLFGAPVQVSLAGDRLHFEWL